MTRVSLYRGRAQAGRQNTAPGQNKELGARVERPEKWDSKWRLTAPLDASAVSLRIQRGRQAPLRIPLCLPLNECRTSLFWLSAVFGGGRVVVS